MRTAVALLALALALAGCVSQKAKQDMAAAQSELAALRQQVQTLPTTVATRDSAAWKQLEQKVRAMPGEFQSELDTWVDASLNETMAENHQLGSRLVADVKKLTTDLEAHAKSTVDKKVQAARRDLEAARGDIESTRAWLGAAGEQAVAQQSGRLTAELRKIQGGLDPMRERLEAVAKTVLQDRRAARLAKVQRAKEVLTGKLAEIENRLAGLAKTIAAATDAARSAP